jgi:hypothetical protein
MIDEFPKRRTRITLFATYPSKPLALAIMSRVPRIPQLKSAFYLFLDAGLLNRLFNGLFGGDFGLFKLDLLGEVGLSDISGGNPAFTCPKIETMNGMPASGVFCNLVRRMASMLVIYVSFCCW